MSYKTILAHFNDEQRFVGLMRVASRIARANAAHLVGLAVMPPTIIVPGSEGDAGAVIEDHRTRYEPQLARMRDAFTAGIDKEGVNGEWLALDCENENPFGDVARVAVAHARTADLVVASTANPSWSLSAYLDVHEALVMDSGRPVLLLPNPPVPESVVARIMVAWNDTRESARAVFDAMPLLRAAETVMVVEVDEGRSGDEARGVPRSDICTTLARQGVPCQRFPVSSPSHGVGAALLEVAESRGVDLIVMGCYGHSRLRELLLGGASRHVLKHLRTPVLLSH